MKMELATLFATKVEGTVLPPNFQRFVCYTNTKVSYLLIVYCRFLQESLSESEQERFLFFNCFLFTKLKTTYQQSKSYNTAFDAVSNWIPPHLVFDRDYLIIPVNERYVISSK